MDNTLLLDSTKLRAWMQCRKKYAYAHLAHLESKNATAIDLVFGSLVHESLEMFENQMLSGLEKDDALQVALTHMHEHSKAWESDLAFVEESRKNRKSAIRLLIWYAEQYHPDGLNTSIKPVVNEMPFRVPLVDLVAASPFAQKINMVGIPRNVIVGGRFDSFIEGPSRGEYWVRERKTTGMALTNHYWARYSPDIQISLYTWVEKVLFPELNLKGVLLEAFQIGTNFIRMARKEIPRWPEQSLETAQSVVACARDMLGHGLLGAGPHSPDRFLMSEGSCMAGGMPCSFQKICNEHPLLRKELIEQQFKQRTPWNPLDGMDPDMIASLDNKPKLHLHS